MLELCCLAIVVAYVSARLRGSTVRASTAAGLAAVVVGGWIGEETMIRTYGFYRYEPARWHMFVGDVPVLIPLIWPVVVDSAWQLARSLTSPARADGSTRDVRSVRRSLIASGVAALLVFADASLIEAVAVRAGLWHWTRPGVFQVPLVGLWGWAAFAMAAAFLLDRGHWRAIAFVPVLPPLVAHVACVAAWFGGLRAIDCPIDDRAAVTVAWLLSIGIVALVRSSGLAARVAPAMLLARVPGALFFFGLLALHADGYLALVAWALAFAPPYLALLDVAQLREAGRRLAPSGEP